VSSQLDASPFAPYANFLNYGYVPNSNPSFSAVKLPESYLNKNATRLILEVIGDCELLPSHDVLDVGCGRGGICHVLRKFFQARSYLGVDLSPTAVAHCQRVHRFPDTRFVEGDAQQLPAGDGSVDVVINVESSHCYPDIFAFYREVHRVLRPGGWFLYTDLIAREKVTEYEQFLEGLGLTSERKRDITSNVVLSCDETAATHAKAFHEGNDRGMLEMFLGGPSSRIYEAMKNGQQKYLLYKLRKVG
jgi:SAM-dependent methyltransferase